MSRGQGKKVEEDAFFLIFILEAVNITHTLSGDQTASQGIAEPLE